VPALELLLPTSVLVEVIKTLQKVKT